MKARRVDIFGAVEPLAQAEVREAVADGMAGYRQGVQAALLGGATFTQAHAAARPLMDRAAALARREGWTERDVRLAVAQEFHG